MQSVDAWKQCFNFWPEGVQRKGVLITTVGEQVPFCEFVPTEAILILERPTPDTMGARTLLVPYDQISVLKITEVIKITAFKSLGVAEAVTAE